MRRIGGCHARSSLRASRPFRDVARSNNAPRASSSLLACRRVSLARRPWKCRLLGASGMPPLACTRASLRIEEPLPPRVEVTELRPPAWDPPPLALWIGGPPSPAWKPPPPHVEVGEPQPPQPLAGVHRRARYRATAVANESRWGVKN
jgi:hypothetical protein